MTYRPEYTLDLDQVGLLRDNLTDVVRIVAVPFPIKPGTWQVAAETVLGQGLVLQTGLQRQMAMELADEAERCLLTLRTYRDYPAERLPAPAPARPAYRRVTIQMLADRIHYMEHDGTPGKPRDTPALRAEAKRRELQPLRDLPLNEISAQKLVGEGAWERLGATRPAPPPKHPKVCWRRLGMTNSGSRYRWSLLHIQGGIEGHTLCGVPYPSAGTHKIRTKLPHNPPSHLLRCQACLGLSKGEKV